MRPIQMVDLKTQYQAIKNEIHQAIDEVLQNATFINGPQVQQFAKALSAYLQIPYVIPCANGTEALQIALMALNLQPGDEVITPSFTYIATTEVIALLKLKPVFVDVDEKTFCINPQQIEKAITAKTKAIIPVHLYGMAAPMEPILKIAEQHGLYVVEDNAQAIGCKYQFSNGAVQATGSMGIIGTTSFFPSKNLGAYGDGGALFTKDEVLAQKIQMIANHGQSKRYYHDIVGCNSRLDSIQAAVLQIKLKYLNQYIEARQKVAAFYNNAFQQSNELITPFVPNYTTHVFHQYTLIIKNKSRDGLHEYLAAQQIPSMIYYPIPCHKQKMFATFEAHHENLPVTDWLTERVLSLPIHTEMNQEQLEYIVHHVLHYLHQ